jgi:recombination protein RecA
VPIQVIPTGSIALDLALGIGGLPAVGSSRSTAEFSGKTTVALHAVASAGGRRHRGLRRRGHALDPDYAKALGDTDALPVPARHR